MKAWAGVLAAAVVGCGGCSLDKKVEIPGFDGPSTLGLSMIMTVAPDVLVADGSSTATVQVTLRDQNGKPVSGRQVSLGLTDSAGRYVDLGTLSATVATTNADGTARVIYTAPYRTDATANQSVVIVGRPVSTDFAGQLNRSVRIELRSPEGRYFPEIPGNTAPRCSFVTEPINGPFWVYTTIPMQSTSADSDGFIVRYEWDFGDDSENDDKPNTNHAYDEAGLYTITHSVVDNGGLSSSCIKGIRVFHSR